MAISRKSVVVGISADGYDAALAYGVAEARRTGLPLHLIHVLPLPAGDAYLGAYGGVLERAKDTLSEAAEAARQLDGEVSMTAELIDSGRVVEDLLRVTEGAELLVLQHRALSRLRRVFTSSAVHGVVGLAPVSVVSVPEGWDPAGPTTGLVTVAVQNGFEAPGLLRAAFDQARSRRSRLVVLHAWWLDSGYDVVVVDSSMREQWTTRARQELEPALAPLRAEFPDVEVVVSVRHAPVVEAVLDAATQSDLLVLGRRHHRLPLHSHLGSVAHAALEHADCPVLITPDHPVDATSVPRPREVAERDLTSTTG